MTGQATTAPPIPAAAPLAGSSVLTACSRRVFSCSVGQLWRLAGHPASLASAVPMLGRFRAPAELKTGAMLEETHTILGVPQEYVGVMTKYALGDCWEMLSRPQGFGLFPVPHDVRYCFRQVPGGSGLSITCDFECRGLLRLPVVGWIVAKLMRRTLHGLLQTLAHRVERSQRYSEVSRASKTCDAFGWTGGSAAPSLDPLNSRAAGTCRVYDVN